MSDLDDVQEIIRLRAERDEWKRIAYSETHGNHCVWQGKYEQAEARLAKVMELHKPVTEWRGLGHDITVCCGDGADWPCPTIAAAQPEEKSRG